MTELDPNATPAGTSGGEDLLASLVGEGRKFKTPGDLARGKIEADNFIEKLKEENTALRALIRNSDETKRGTEVMEELLARVSKGTLVDMKPPEGTKPNGQEQGTQPQVLTSRDVEQVYKTMRQREREEANEATAFQKLLYWRRRGCSSGNRCKPVHPPKPPSGAVLQPRPVLRQCAEAQGRKQLRKQGRDRCSRRRAHCQRVTTSSIEPSAL